MHPLMTSICSAQNIEMQLKEGYPKCYFERRQKCTTGCFHTGHSYLQETPTSTLPCRVCFSALILKFQLTLGLPRHDSKKRYFEKNEIWPSTTRPSWQE